MNDCFTALLTVFWSYLVMAVMTQKVMPAYDLFLSIHLLYTVDPRYLDFGYLE